MGKDSTKEEGTYGLQCDFGIYDERHGAAGMGKIDPVRLERGFKELAAISTKNFDRYSESILHTVKYHLLDHIVEDIPRVGAISVLYSCSYDHFNEHMRQGYK